MVMRNQFKDIGLSSLHNIGILHRIDSEQAGSAIIAGTLDELRTARRIICEQGHFPGPRGSYGRYVGENDYLLLCQCQCLKGWCRVTRQELLDGVTHACFRKNCQPPKPNHR